MKKVTKNKTFGFYRVKRLTVRAGVTSCVSGAQAGNVRVRSIDSPKSVRVSLNTCKRVRGVGLCC